MEQQAVILFPLHVRKPSDGERRTTELVSLVKGHLSKMLGLSDQAYMARVQLDGLGGSTILTPPLSPQEFRIWEQWMPASYTGSYHHANRIWYGCGFAYSGIDNFRRGAIPAQVLLVIADSKDLFESFEIRTQAEGEKVFDLALFGSIRDQVYLLAHWAESDRYLLPFDEIRDRLQTAKVKKRTAIMSYLALFVLGFYLAAPLLLSESLPRQGLNIITVIGMVMMLASVIRWMIGLPDFLNKKPLTPRSSGLREGNRLALRPD